ncbi:sigma factor [Umezawaea sp. Da 62-37]|uniref:sigma factor n=1 Tax=Umezawaea sp. Da 62-37 TaxID=3075927 RepID=UPI0028F703FA|nr:sigma factor [Umezawaea sp. Da 62-37]WNV89036.1 sigma factor [Umezawaea sp. Da 62-37]
MHDQPDTARETRPPLEAGDSLVTGPVAVDDVETLLARIAQGDRHAFDRLYDHAAAHVLWRLRRVLTDPDEAEEAAHEVWLQIWRSAGRYDPLNGTTMSWIMGLARRHAVHRLRQR